MRKTRKTFGISAAAFAAVITVSGCVSTHNGPVGDWYTRMGGSQPVGNALYLCHGFGCKYQSKVLFSSSDDRRMRSILRAGRRSPEAERAAISKLVIWQEKRVGPIIGSSDDIGGLDMHNAGVRGQMDCIDEAANTTSLLLYAQSKGYLRHHDVKRPTARGFFLDGKYPHATAVILDREANEPYSVDSWRLANGKAPDILPISRWMKIKASDL